MKIIGLQSGYTAPEGHSNIIPGNAMARITCRLVNNQSSPEIIGLIKKHINKNLPEGTTVRYKPSNEGVGARPMKFPANTKEYKYIVDALKKYMVNLYQNKWAGGGSIGSLLSIQEVLGLTTYSLGFELPDENWHASNEFSDYPVYKKVSWFIVIIYITSPKKK